MDIKINDINELRAFIGDVTLLLQKHCHLNPTVIEPMFQRAYRLYVKYDVEKEWSEEDIIQETLSRIIKRLEEEKLSTEWRGLYRGIHIDMADLAIRIVKEEMKGEK